MTNATPPPPPGWYPDATGITRWWDGRQWGVTAPEHAAKVSNPTGMLGFVLSLAAMVSVFYLPVIVVWFLAFAAFVLSIVGVCLTGKSRGPAIAGLVISFVAFVATFTNFLG